MGSGRGAAPRFEDTGLSRDDLEEAADELGVEHEDVDDQTLLERLGVELGQLDPPDDEGDDGSQGDTEDDGAADGEEQAAPGEPIEGRTRDELRDELRDRGLPVSGSKSELEERLREADEGDGD
jgi:hypothetical protein